MARNHLINGKLVPFTAEEETARDAEEAAWAEKETELAKTLYQRKRTGEAATSAEDMQYPSVGEQLDLLWHAIDADADLKVKLAGFYNAIKAIKDKYPKS